MTSTPVVEDFHFDDKNESKIAEHHLHPDTLYEVLDGLFRIRKNRKNRRAPFLIIGKDYQGRCIAIPIEPTQEREIWRPVTAWFCKPHEWQWLP